MRTVNWLSFFFFNDTATTEIYTLSLHDALPISSWSRCRRVHGRRARGASPRNAQNFSGWRRAARTLGVRRGAPGGGAPAGPDRKSTRLNSSHDQISYAVFCLKKKEHSIQLRLAP